MVDGLWGSDPLVIDFAAVVLRQRLLGEHLGRVQNEVFSVVWPTFCNRYTWPMG